MSLTRHRAGRFARTPASSARSREWSPSGVFAAMAAALVVPVVLILGYLVVEAWPVLELAFLLDEPARGMTAGGIWAPLVGTFFLVVISLAVAAPIGVLAGVYLNEYARDNWFTRIVNLAVVNLAGVPSIVHALFGVGAFVLFAGMGDSVLAASLHAGRDDAAGDHHQHARGAGRACRCRSARPAGTWAPPAGRRSARSCCPTRSAAS